MAVANQIATSTIVNAAFLQEVKDSNNELWAILEELRAMELQPKDPRSESRNLVVKLSELRDCIALEFSLEETYGFIEGAPNNHSLGLADAGKAKTQHRELYLQLHEICERAEEAQYQGTISRDLPMFIGAFEQFDDQLRAHEDFESELIRCGLGISEFGSRIG